LTVFVFQNRLGVPQGVEPGEDSPEDLDHLFPPVFGKGIDKFFDLREEHNASVGSGVLDIHAFLRAAKCRMVENSHQVIKTLLPEN